MCPSAGYRPCTTPGCGELVTGTAKCADCRAEVEVSRGTPEERGYGPAHRALRKKWLPLVAQGHVACWRCGEPISPGDPWDLGHDDRNRSVYRGPEHERCNRAASARRANRNRKVR